MLDSRVGIDAIAVHVPRYFLALKSLAEAHGVDENKYLVGLGAKRMAHPAPDEDPVTMAASAARRLMSSYSVSTDQIGLVIVGSETAVDSAKATAAYVHGLLGLPPHCRTFDVKHACYSATAGMRIAADWCLANPHPRRKALVIATDIARYEVGSPGEPTQGAGAVAMLVSRDPELMRLHRFPEAAYAEDVMDFWRPTYRKCAVVDGALSIKTYLKALEHTYRQHKESSTLGFFDFDYLLFHVPFPKMAYKAHRCLYHLEVPSPKRAPSRLEESFQERTAPALVANEEVGNIYAGSLYLSLAGLLENRDLDLASRRVGLFSYGSGCVAEFFSGELGPSSSAWRNRTGLREALTGRRALSHAEYLGMRAEGDAMSRSAFHSPHPSFSVPHSEGDRFLGIRDHRRFYAPAVLEQPVVRTADEPLPERRPVCTAP
jgi:hydroxymethylglutaryl-CoA synthase